MNNRITRRKVAKQFIIAIELLLEWWVQVSGCIQCSLFLLITRTPNPNRHITSSSGSTTDYCTDWLLISDT
jgi:hypothetical protein